MRPRSPVWSRLGALFEASWGHLETRGGSDGRPRGAPRRAPWAGRARAGMPLQGGARRGLQTAALEPRWQR
eukprot:720646-Pyramimonas_sp.AAC.1